MKRSRNMRSWRWTLRPDLSPRFLRRLQSHRQAAPDDLKTQSKLARDLLDAFPFRAMSIRALKATMCSARWRAWVKTRASKSTVVTGDGDALQLVDDKVRVLLTRRGVSDLECFTTMLCWRATVLNRNCCRLKGLRGDTSDNIPGVPASATNRHEPHRQVGRARKRL
jgi:DNA polymerase-1